MIECGDCLDVMRAMESKRFKLTMFSPPYPLKTQRYPGARAKLKWDEWSEWMAEVVAECCRVTDGFVIVNAKNPIKDGEELPATDWLRIRARQLGCKLERPVIWHKNSAPNTRPWWVNDWEPLMAFYFGKRPRPTTWNWEAIAKPSVYKSGGRFQHREADGSRKQNGGSYPTTQLARPRDVIRVTVGGGHMGSKLAADNEAPYPEAIVEPIVLALSNPGDVVFDPFCGSGTTLAVALKLGRGWHGIDCRDSQVKLSQRRMLEAAAIVEAANVSS
jgi:DNA modification methylase